MIAPVFANLETQSDSSKFEFYKIDVDGEEPADQVVDADKGKASEGQTLSQMAGITAVSSLCFASHIFPLRIARIPD